MAKHTLSERQPMTLTPPRRWPGDLVVVDAIRALAERDPDAAVHRAWDEGLITRAQLEAAYYTGVDVLELAGIVPPEFCTGTLYAVNPDAPDEGSDIHHDGPCPVHPEALAVPHPSGFAP